MSKLGIGNPSFVPVKRAFYRGKEQSEITFGAILSLKFIFLVKYDQLWAQVMCTLDVF